MYRIPVFIIYDPFFEINSSKGTQRQIIRRNHLSAYRLVKVSSSRDSRGNPEGQRGKPNGLWVRRLLLQTFSRLAKNQTLGNIFFRILMDGARF